MLAQICAVAAGGAIGASGRYLVSLACASAGNIAPWLAGDFPWATFFANFIGCFVIGVLSVLFDEGPWRDAESWRLFAITGLLGGFTTFSTFGLETITLMERGEHALAVANAGGSLVACLAGVFAGRILTSMLVAKN